MSLRIPTLALAALACSACVTDATEVLVALDTDVPPTRSMSITVNVRRAGYPADSGQMRAWTRGNDAGGITLPATFAIVPAPEERTDDSVTLDVRAALGPAAGQPAVTISRTASFQFVPHRAITLRIFLANSCAVITTGCGTGGVPCTLSQLCVERGQTCGEGGTCVSTTVSFDDAGGPAVDASDVVVRDMALPTDMGTRADIAVPNDVCSSDCSGRECGPDPRCGRSCGSCSAGSSCSGSGRCEAMQRCGDGQCNGGETCASCSQDCGCNSGQMCTGGSCCTPSCSAPCVSDGCGGTCGGCPTGQSCSAGACRVRCGDSICAPFVEGCASCPGDCPCPGGQVCSSAGVCCAPSCPASCGSDGCGSYCGSCPTGQSCRSTGCRAVCGDGMCAPFVEGCASCPGDCPCPGGNVCFSGVCCAPSCPASCGSDGCGNYCGSCPPGLSCRSTGCRAVCGDGMCAPSIEGCGNCPGDCPCPTGTSCSAGVCV